MNCAYLDPDSLKAWRNKLRKTSKIIRKTMPSNPYTHEQLMKTPLVISRKRRKQPEGQIAESLVRWFAFAYAGFGLPDSRLLVHVPNEGSKTSKIDYIRGARLKRMGKVAGVSDYILFVPRGQYHGLCLELKAPKGKASLQQIEWMDMVAHQGYKTAVAFSLNDAMQVITDYLRL